MARARPRAGLSRPSWVAVGVRRAVAALQPDLMRKVTLRPVEEELRVAGDPTVLADVELDHPAVQALVVELLVDGAIERVGEVDAPAVAADLDHLRPAGER